MIEKSYATWPQLEVALRAVGLKWVEASLVNIAYRDPDRLSFTHVGSQKSPRLWSRNDLVVFIRCNHPNDPGLVKTFTETLDAEIAKVAQNAHNKPKPKKD